MESTAFSNFDILSDYFTSKEFSFINNINSENKKYDDFIVAETEYRDAIVALINSLRERIFNAEQSNSQENFSTILNDAQNIFELINQNIQSVQALQSISEQISNNTVELLVSIEANKDNSDTYNDKIQDLKNMVTEMSSKDNNAQEQIYKNTLLINNFFGKKEIKDCLAYINIKLENDLSDYHDNKFFHTPRVPSNNSANDFSNNDIDISLKKSNNTLLVSDRLRSVFLPYTEDEISLYLSQYPNEYHSFDDVIKKEYVLPLNYYMTHPILARFRESYALIRDREGKSVVDAFKFAFNIMLKHELNPTIIAACKTQTQLEHYIDCLYKNRLEDFHDFNIKFDITPLT